MMKLLKVTILIFLLTSCICLAQGTKPLFEIEKKFCGVLAEKGLSNAFLQFIGVDGIIIAPKPTDGAQYYQKKKDDSKSLFWEAEFAEMSLNNAFGYTTGPWNNKKQSKDGREIVSYGHYVTVWQKFNGEWKFLIDCGISYNEKELKNAPGSGSIRAVSQPELKKDRFPFEPVLVIDNELNNSIFENGLCTAIEKSASQNIRIYRSNKYPATGYEYIKSLIPNTRLSVMHLGGKASSAGDFAFTYGIAGKNIDKPEYSYLRIWKKEGADWKIVLDLMSNIR